MKNLIILNNKDLILIYKYKNFLDFGESFLFFYDYSKNNKFVYFFIEDLMKKNNINFIKFFSRTFSYNFQKIDKNFLIFFSKFFKNFKGGSIYCNFFNDNFLYIYIHFLKINKEVLESLEIRPLIFILDYKLYSIFPFLNMNNILNPFQQIYDNIFFIFNKIIYFLKNK